MSNRNSDLVREKAIRSSDTRGWMSSSGGQTAVQGGYVPTTSQSVTPPPKGGSGVTPPKR